MNFDTPKIEMYATTTDAVDSWLCKALYPNLMWTCYRKIAGPYVEAMEPMRWGCREL